MSSKERLQRENLQLYASPISQEIPVEGVASIVYKIITPENSGSGFYFQDMNVIITNFHVIKGYRIVGIEDVHKNSFSARVIIGNPAYDLALLKPNQEINTRQKIQFLTSDQLKTGDEVKVLGYPYGMPFTVTEGIISSTSQLISGKNFIQTDAAVNPGNSGGPIIDKKGNIIGVTTLYFREADNIAFAIPMENVLEDLKDYQNNQNQFTIKCPSCLFPLYEPIEFCSNCGVELKDIVEFFSIRKKNFLETFIEEILTEFHIDPIAAQKEKDFWEFYYGTSLIRFFRYKKNYYIITSPMVHLPRKNLELFYKFIISDPYPPFILGIYKNKLFLSLRFHIEDLKENYREEWKQHIRTFIQNINDRTKFFIDEFQCELVEETKKENYE